MGEFPKQGVGSEQRPLYWADRSPKETFAREGTAKEIVPGIKGRTRGGDFRAWGRGQRLLVAPRRCQKEARQPGAQEGDGSGWVSVLQAVSPLSLVRGQ